MGIHSKVVELRSVYHPTEIFDEAQERIEKRFVTGIYWPLLSVLKLSRKSIQNSQASDLDALNQALQRGTVTFNRGVFSGRFNSTIARAMRQIGARFEDGAYRIHYDELPKTLRDAVELSDRSFSNVLRKLDQKLSEVAKVQEDKVTPFQDLFSRAVFKADKDFEENVKNVSLKVKVPSPESLGLGLQLRVDKKSKLAEWQENLNVSIKNWESDEIKKLRAKVKETYFSGDRYGTLIDLIHQSHDVSDRKALFLARQETHLLVGSYVQSQYQENGIPEYRWKCVTGSPEHPVRPYHKLLDGTIQRWDSPPIVDKYGNRMHPAIDYNCRCRACPIIRVD